MLHNIVSDIFMVANKLRLPKKQAQFTDLSKIVETTGWYPTTKY